MRGRIPLLVIPTAAYIAGVCTGENLNLGSMVIAALLAACVTVLLWLEIKRVNNRLIVIGAAFLLLGMLTTSLAGDRLSEGLLYSAAKESSYATLEGVLANDSRWRAGIGRFDMNVARARVNGQEWSTNERVRVVVRSERDIGVVAGTAVRVEGRLGLPRSDGDFDYRRYLYHHGIAATVSVSPEDVEVLHGTRPRLLTYPVLAAGTLRGWIKERNSARLPRICAGLLNGIVLGDASMLSEEVDESFKTTGLTHVVAASGMNIALIIGALWPLVRLARARAGVQYAVLLAAAAFYVLLSGAQPSITRAFIMAVVGMTAWLLGRGKDHVASLAAAALIILLIDPFSLYDIGFQLSFAATAAIILLVPLFEAMAAGIPRMLRSALSVTLAAQAGALPLMVYHFGCVSTISLLANMVVAPLAGPVLILGMAVIPLEAMLPVLASPVYALLRGLLVTIVAAADTLASIPGSTLYVKQPGIVVIVAGYLITGAGVLLLRKLKVEITFAHIVMALIAVSAFSIWWQVGQASAPSQFEMVFLDVGQGDAALLLTPDGARVLVDAGPDPQSIKRALDERGIRSVDAVFLTHEHADHVGGMPGLLRAFSVGSVLYPRSLLESEAGRALVMEAKGTGSSVLEIDDGDSARFGKALTIHTLVASEAAVDENGKSAVFLAEYGDLSVLFTGDAGEDVERELVGVDYDLDVDILKVGHHGSASSSSADFLRCIRPEVAVVSVGRGNMYGHPSQAAMRRLRAAGSRIYRTDLQGDIVVRSDGNAYGVFVER